MAEKDVLLTEVPPMPDKMRAKLYMQALANVNGWSLTESSKSVFVVKAPDLAKHVQIPLSAFNEDSRLAFDKLGFEIVEFNNLAYVRVPQGFKMPKLKAPVPLRYHLRITQYDAQNLEDLGISVDILSKLQNDSVSLLSRFTITDILTGSVASASESAKYLSTLSSIKLSKLKKSMRGQWTVSLDGNSVSSVNWSEEQKKNVLVESRNVDDARVSVDREVIEAGRTFKVRPLGGALYRVTLSDLAIGGSDGLDVTGLKYSGDVNLAVGHATWVYSGRIRSKKKGLFARGYEIRDQKYVVTLQVVTNPKVKKITKLHKSPPIPIAMPVKKKRKFRLMFWKKRCAPCSKK